MDLITLICPVYNAEKYLFEVIDSLNKQVYKNFTVYFIDDGSTDDSVKTINEIPKKFKYRLFTQENKGAPAARNLGLKYVESEYIYIFDSDDKLKPNTLELLIKYMKETDADIVMGNMNILGQEKQIIKAKCFEDWLETAMKWTPTPGVHLLKKSLIKDHSIYFSDIRIGQDLNYFLKYLSYCKKIAFIDEVIYSYRVDSPGISRTYSVKVKDIVKSLEEAELFYRDKDKIFIDLKMKNYYAQFCKFRYINNFEERCDVYYYFLNHILSLRCYSLDHVITKVQILFKCIIKFIFLFIN